MKYKTKRDVMKPFVIFFMVLWIAMFVPKLQYEIFRVGKDSDLSWFFYILYFISWSSILIYCYSRDYRIKKAKKKGRRLEGYIESVVAHFAGRLGYTYVLEISFFDGQKKVRKTEHYRDDPNTKLTSRKCSIYELNGKYIEADFAVVSNKKEKSDLGIPKTYKSW